MDEIEALIEGFGRFRRDYYERERERFRRLVDSGQQPKVAMIACSDSRVDPAIVLQAGPGELFLVRNVANLVPPCEQQGLYHGTSAALEFAVQGLGVRHVIVFGHARCGGVRALLDRDPAGGKPRSFVDAWMGIAEPVRRRIAATLADADTESRRIAAEQGTVRLSLDNLMTFPFVRERVEIGALELHGWYFDLIDGRLFVYDAKAGRFVPAGPQGSAP